MTEAQIRAIIKGLHPDIKVSEGDVRLFQAIAEAERQACIDIINIEHIAKPEIIRAIRQRGND